MSDPTLKLLAETSFDWHPPDDDLSLAEPNPHRPTPIGVTTHPGWQPIDLLAFADRDAVTPTLAGLIYPAGTRHLFSGEPESGKTLAAFALGLEEIRAGGRILHLDFEMFTGPTRERLREMGATDAELAAWIHVEPDAPPRNGDLDGLLALEPTLAIVDAAAGAYAALGLDDNARKDVEVYARQIVGPLARAGVSSITVDHVTKNREGRGRFAIGSERKVGGVEVHLSFEAVRPLHRGSTGLVRITVAKDRAGYLPRPHACDLELASDPDTHAITWTFTTTPKTEPGTWRPTALMEKVSRYLEAQTTPVPRGAIETAKLGKQTIYVRQALDALVADGYATETPGPRGARLYQTITLFTSSTSSDLVSPRPDEDVTTSSTSSPPTGDEDETRTSRRAQQHHPVSDEDVTADGDAA